MLINLLSPMRQRLRPVVAITAGLPAETGVGMVTYIRVSRSMGSYTQWCLDCPGRWGLNGTWTPPRRLQGLLLHSLLISSHLRSVARKEHERRRRRPVCCRSVFSAVDCWLLIDQMKRWQLRKERFALFEICKGWDMHPRIVSAM